MGGESEAKLDFTNNFMRRLVSRAAPQGVFDAESGKPSVGASSLLADALFGIPSNGLCPAAIGQFAPGAAGGPNATSGYEASANVNTWDFILMLEGATAFAGSAARRHQGQVDSGASFPFTVRAVGAGWGGVEATDENDARAEFWAPLWRQSARYCEIDALLSEGRAVLNGRTARDGLEFARAAASLGVSRGFSEFERYGFLMRAGKAYLAAPVGRRSTVPSLASRLVVNLDAGGWLDRVRRIGRSGEQPATAKNSLKRFEDALFALVVTEHPADQVQRTLVALGEVCGWLTTSKKAREAVGSPPPVLGANWISMADDGSAEFRVAVALAGLGLLPARQEEEKKSGTTTDGTAATDDGITIGANFRTISNRAPPMAAHLAPIDEARFLSPQGARERRAWSHDESPPSFVWGKGSLITNMISVMERRLVEVGIRNLDDKPVAGVTPARLADVAAFLSDDFNDARCAALLAGLIWARPAHLGTGPGNAHPCPVPFAYAALKPVFTPDRTLRSIGALTAAARLPIPAGLMGRLRAAGATRDGQATDEVTRAALARARASGLPSAFDPALAGGRWAGTEGSRIGAGLRADRLAAALLVPIADRALETLINRAYPGVISERTDESTEDN